MTSSTFIVNGSSSAGHVSGAGLPERGRLHIYDDHTKQWSTRDLSVKISPTPCAQGSNRYCYHMTDLSTGAQMVAKRAKVPESQAETLKAVVMQQRVKRIGDRFNTMGTPKKMEFIEAYALELLDRPRDHMQKPPLMLVEPLLHGYYKKHSNNFGFVDREDRNTPQAFSHWSYQHSGGKIIVVDLQGVGDQYTDPQIHSNQPMEEPPVWGQGDMGEDGIRKFFETHRCNDLCRMLGLTPLQAHASMTLPLKVLKVDSGYPTKSSGVYSNYTSFATQAAQPLHTLPLNQSTQSTLGSTMVPRGSSGYSYGSGLGSGMLGNRGRAMSPTPRAMSPNPRPVISPTIYPSMPSATAAYSTYLQPFAALR
uniref:Alpha-type protein kinase domain-containing protein n=1 Tax=Eutreptiella gymnastica TaxID=73025 RepID=A0A7S1N9K8_9EUGL|mmetsp:Transcript_142397/g.248345  ORF Transcript_142397/g.248345 Transcript_142397/m.248345 type:complete len:365 (+) Transcript_142397:99-1193(+)